MSDLLRNLPPNRSHALNLVNTQLQKLVLQDLKSVCRQEGLTVSGKKAELQQRIHRRFEDYLNNHPDNESFDLLFLRIHRPNEQIGYHHLYSNPSPLAHSSQHTSEYSSPMTRPVAMPRPVPSPIKFVESPFFKRRAVITTFKLPACQNARHDVSGPIPLSATQLEELRGNSSFRAIVYCGETHSSGHLGTNVKFPTQLEMRVNDQDVKANFKGVGKKEGSVKPVDITPFIRKQHGLNYFKLTYALTSKLFHVVIMLVEKQSAESLVEHIRGKIITKGQTIAEVKSKAQDTDIVFGSYTMSLKDAASQVRIQLPCRGMNCTHFKCFDATTYLQMQEQAPLWTCPICDKPAPFGSLAVDEYFKEILAETPRSVDSVIIEPDGSWSVDTSASNTTGYSDSDEDSDDLIEISGTRALSSTMGGGTPRSFSVQTPNSTISARGSISTASRGQKRQTEVIDLTLSDDEAPAPKRPNIGAILHLPTAPTGGNLSKTLPSFRPASSLSFNMPAPPTGLSFPNSRTTLTSNSLGYQSPWAPPPPPPPPQIQQHQLGGSGTIQNFRSIWSSTPPNNPPGPPQYPSSHHS